jgi:multidrug resistance efflux pump
VKDGQVVGQISQLGSSEEIKTAKQQLDQAQRDYDMSKVEDETTIAGIRATIAGLGSRQAHDAGTAAKAQGRRRAAHAEPQGRLVTQTDGRSGRTRSRELRGEPDRQRRADLEPAGADPVRAAADSRQGRSCRESAPRARAGERGDQLAGAGHQHVEGHVIELRHRVGDFVRNGEVVATIEPPSTNIEPVVYINSANGKRVKPGMEVQVSPTTVRREEYGFMKGQIRTVGEYAVTADAVESVTGNKQLVEELLKSGTKVEVQVGLLANRDTASGYTWSSSGGPPFKIEGGTKVSVSVVASQTSPFNYYVTPIFRNMFGL